MASTAGRASDILELIPKCYASFTIRTHIQSIGHASLRPTSAIKLEDATATVRGGPATAFATEVERRLKSPGSWHAECSNNVQEEAVENEG